MVEGDVRVAVRSPAFWCVSVSPTSMPSRGWVASAAVMLIVRLTPAGSSSGIATPTAALFTTEVCSVTYPTLRTFSTNAPALMLPKP
ncbi:MAG: hypothetical protein A4E60_03577 [Syntrophorhabdus sp. PtaB.Bin047]|nr:MAG: hypothetical protein A4E60_03577 [Syntrophorhabdus sp. PtaB.Bin047]